MAYKRHKCPDCGVTTYEPHKGECVRDHKAESDKERDLWEELDSFLRTGSFGV